MLLEIINSQNYFTIGFIHKHVKANVIKPLFIHMFIPYKEFKVMDYGKINYVFPMLLYYLINYWHTIRHKTYNKATNRLFYKIISIISISPQPIISFESTFFPTLQTSLFVCLFVYMVPLEMITMKQ